MFRSVSRSFLISRALVVLFASLGYFLLPPFQDGIAVPLHESAPWFVSMWYHWDANWYMSIVEGGYRWITTDQSNVAFFPLYPLLVRGFGWVLGEHFLLAGLLLSAAFMFAALCYLYRLAELDFGRDVAARAVWLLALYPASFFLNALYTESLFLLTSVAAFYYARRNRWALAGAWGLLASLTRVTGLLLLIPLVYEYLSQRDFSPLRSLRPAALWLMLVPCGVAVYMGYLYLGFGNPFAFAETQTIGWGHQLTPALWSSLTHDISYLTDNSEPWVVYDLAATLLLAVATVFAIRRLRGSYAIYMVLSLLFPLAGGTSKSMIRYVLVVFPVFLLLGLLTRRPAWRWAVIGASVVLLGVSTAVFATGRWIA